MDQTTSTTQLDVVGSLLHAETVSRSADGMSVALDPHVDVTMVWPYKSKHFDTVQKYVEQITNGVFNHKKFACLSRSPKCNKGGHMGWSCTNYIMGDETAPAGALLYKIKDCVFVEEMKMDDQGQWVISKLTHLLSVFVFRLRDGALIPVTLESKDKISENSDKYCSIWNDPRFMPQGLVMKQDDC